MSLERPNQEELNLSQEEEPLIDNSPFREEKPKPCHELSGIIKISFFFYQTASIIRIVASAKTYYHMPGVVNFLFTFFNIKLDFTSSFIKICPLCTNSIVVMDALKSSLSLACLAMLLLAMLICVLVRCVLKRRTEDGNTSQIGQQSILRRLKGPQVVDYLVPVVAPGPCGRALIKGAIELFIQIAQDLFCQVRPEEP